MDLQNIWHNYQPILCGCSKGLYTSTKGCIDPLLYGDIRNLYLRFQQLYILCRHPRHIHDRRFIHTLCQHIFLAISRLRWDMPSSMPSALPFSIPSSIPFWYLSSRRYRSFMASKPRTAIVSIPTSEDAKTIAVLTS